MHDGAATKSSPAADTSHRGRLNIGFELDPKGRTFVANQFCSYPFHVGRVFYLDDGATAGMATLYTQSCSGGLYTEDELRMSLDLSRGAQAHLTTQASTIVHRGTRGPSCQNVSIRAAANSFIEYLPDTTILLPGAMLNSKLSLEIAPDASAILFDSFLSHDFTGKGDVFDTFSNDISIFRSDGTPLVIDRFCIDGSEFADSAVGVTGGFPCHGSVLVIAPNIGADILVETVRADISWPEGSMIGVSALPRGIGFSARILSHNAIAMRKAMFQIWARSRESITGSAATPRRK